ncbi:aminoacyl-tRNA deacylase [Williamsia deligens]|uniref:Cys-tRNA(Pro)/Cys-tRNA(Cys) deacylase n=1 Tax=Williamsia deligens TaxID=321325 RepID=A0ABW3G2K1_9NOCA|nr:aminoacyl-tRNA deacylase [Williamsia deligens]MCP2194808.1 Cys-tRNA(Pro)/Cys-tRNA(Cys) deacylase [Williamsia deligens]
MGVSTPATAALEAAGIAFAVHRYRPVMSGRSFGDDAVDHMTRDIGVDEEQVLKTLVVSAPGAGRTGLAVAVLAVPRRMAPKAVGAALGVPRVDMAEAAVVTRSTGYVLGGVSPIGQRRALPTVLDETATLFPTVLCSGGRRGLEIELSPADLVAVTGAVVADISA